MWERMRALKEGRRERPDEKRKKVRCGSVGKEGSKRDKKEQKGIKRNKKEQKGIKRNKKEQKGTKREGSLSFREGKGRDPDAEGNGCTGETEKIEKKVEFFRKM